MRAVCLGGGPGGLYFAISLKRRDSAHEVVVIERNRPDDTFGWGVVLSDETLANLEANDAESASGRSSTPSAALRRPRSVRSSTSARTGASRPPPTRAAARRSETPRVTVDGRSGSRARAAVTPALRPAAGGPRHAAAEILSIPRTATAAWTVL